MSQDVRSGVSVSVVHPITLVVVDRVASGRRRVVVVLVRGHVTRRVLDRRQVVVLVVSVGSIGVAVGVTRYSAGRE